MGTTATVPFASAETIIVNDSGAAAIRFIAFLKDSLTYNSYFRMGTSS